VPTIPTPFIGGADGPHRDRTTKTDIEPPFFAEAAEPPEQAEPGAGAPQPAETEAETETPFFLEPEPAEQPAPAPEAAPEEEPVPIESVAPTAEPAPDFLAPTADEPPQEAPAGSPEEEGLELPDYFFGPDTPPPLPSPAQETAAAPPLPESPELLAHKAEELLEGAHGDRIRDLVAGLGSAAAEVAITRAFAAGYMAAKNEER
jgi:hypothetical protein